MKSLRWAVLVLLFAPAACSTNPYTGRKQLMLMSSEQEVQLGAQAYQEAMAAETRVTRDPQYFDVVNRVAKRLSAEVEKGLGDVKPPGYTWEVQVIDNPKVANAWCLPGGKIAVYTGIFPMCKDENGLAVVMGHEMMHAVLRHGNERVSQGMLGEVGTSVLAEVIGGDNPEKKKTIHGLLGMGATVGVLLPYNRKQETEADRYGLQLAARAGYDPRAAVDLWKRMGQAAGDAGPEFLSTHPDPENRVKNMEEWMPEAMAIYEKSSRQSAVALAEPGRARVSQREATSDAVLVLESSKREGAGLQFTMTPKRDVYLKRITAQGPDGKTSALDANTGLPANQKRVLSLKEGPAGAYVFQLEGTLDGQPWKQKLEAKVQ
jgi:predicted Zn-dependent protease